LVDWYRFELPLTLGHLKQPLVIVLIVGVFSIIASYVWVVINVPIYIDISPERATEFRAFVAENVVNLDRLDEQLPAPLLFFNNVRATVVFLLAGLVSFGTLGLTFFMVNFVLVGGVLGAAEVVGFSPLLTLTVGILPHGIFELTAVILATAAMLKVGAQLVSTDTDKSLGETVLLSLADWFRIFIGFVVPLLAVAAVVEIYVTPALIKLAFPQI